jgi:sugar-specific transcriptional regulator TrmB
MNTVEPRLKAIYSVFQGLIPVLEKFEINSDALDTIKKEIENAKGAIRNLESDLESLSHPAVYNIETIIQGNVSLGDIFENIHASTIINKSMLENSFNKVKKEHNEQASKALVKVAEFIEKSGDPAAGALFNNFTEELNKPQPDKSRLKSFWSGIEKALPSIASVSEAVAKIVTLF